MHTPILTYCLLALATVGQPLVPGNTTRTMQVDGRERSYLAHVPANYVPKRPAPVVLALHGAFTNALVTELYSGLNATAERHGFIVVYPNGTGASAGLLFWNSGGWDKRVLHEPPDDVAYIGLVLDDLATVANVDAKRVYATGISNGGMMCYRLAAEMADRIAAIAPIAGTLCLDQCQPKRPVPVLHIHGSDDQIVPFGGRSNTPSLPARREEGGSPQATRRGEVRGTREDLRKTLGFKSVDDTIRTWAKLDGCPETPRVESLPDTADDGTTVERKTYGPGRDGSEVILLEIHGGGHTWPGRPEFLRVLGKSTRDIDANEMIWEFFQRHPLP